MRVSTEWTMPLAAYRSVEMISAAPFELYTASLPLMATIVS